MIKNQDNNKSKKELSLLMFAREVNNRIRFIGVTKPNVLTIEKAYKKGLTVSDAVSSFIK